VTRQLSVIQPIESLLERIAEACGRVLDCGSVGIRVVDGAVLVLSGTYGDADVAMPTMRLEIGESLSGVVAATGEPLITNDLAADPRLIAAHRRVTERLGYQAYLGVPVKLGDELLGVLSARTKRSGGFNEDDVAIATAFAAQAAAAIENARLYQRAQQAYQQMVAAQEQLVAAQKMEAIGRLAGGIAHDFNNLLTVIAGRATLLETDLPPGDRLRRHAELIQSTAWRAGSLTQQLLAFGRRQVLQPKVVQLNDIVRSMGTMLRPLIGEHNELVLTLEPGLPFVKVDPAQLEQVVVNLVVNSRDAMPAGGRVCITTSTTEVTRDAAALADEVPCGTWVRLSVTDTGIGMDAATKAHIFEPFFTTKGQGKGTGLGLATVYGIIKQSGGYLDVHSAPDLGTTITVHLPAVAATPDDVPRTASGTMPVGTETILLVEDEEPVRELLSELLGSCGYSVLTACDGVEALKMWREEWGASVDLVVSDVVMPRMNGPEFVRRASALRPGVPVIYISGYNDLPVADLATLHESGALLEKPFTLDMVAAKVREALDARESRAST
jgi:signal transduction histidine kinase/ActR/RegA family two-component response regulator